MRRWPALLLMLSVCGCKTSSSQTASASLSAKVDEAAHAAMSETRTVTQGPETVTTYEFGPPSVDYVTSPVVGAVAGGAGYVVNVAQYRPAVAAGAPRTEEAQDDIEHDGSLPPHGPLLKVTIDQRGGVVTESQATASRATETHAEAAGHAEDEKKKNSGPAGLMGLLGVSWPWLIVVAVVLCGGGVALWWRRAKKIAAASEAAAKAVLP